VKRQAVREQRRLVRSGRGGTLLGRSSGRWRCGGLAGVAQIRKSAKFRFRIFAKKKSRLATIPIPSSIICQWQWVITPLHSSCCHCHAPCVSRHPTNHCPRRTSSRTGVAAETSCSAPNRRSTFQSRQFCRIPCP
jgi:hypothetical protein